MEKMWSLVLTREKGFFARKLQNQEWEKVKEGMKAWQDAMSRLGEIEGVWMMLNSELILHLDPSRNPTNA